MTIKRIPATPAGPNDGPPYSNAVCANGFIFVSGQVGLDDEGRLAEGGIIAETRQAIDNIGKILASAGSDLGHVVKATVWLIDPGDYKAFNQVYKDHFGADLPARACVRSDLMGPYRVEIEVIATAKS